MHHRDHRAHGRCPRRQIVPKFGMRTGVYIWARPRAKKRGLPASQTHALVNLPHSSTVASYVNGTEPDASGERDSTTAKKCPGGSTSGPSSERVSRRAPGEPPPVYPILCFAASIAAIRSDESAHAPRASHEPKAEGTQRGCAATNPSHGLEAADAAPHRPDSYTRRPRRLRLCEVKKWFSCRNLYLL